MNLVQFIEFEEEGMEIVYIDGKNQYSDRQTGFKSWAPFGETPVR